MLCLLVSRIWDRSAVRARRAWPEAARERFQTTYTDIRVWSLGTQGLQLIHSKLPLRGIAADGKAVRIWWDGMAGSQ